MNRRLVIDRQSQLQKSAEPGLTQQPAGVKLAAKIISYIFHPVFVPLYLVLFMVYVHPYLFAGSTAWEKTLALIQAFTMFTFFPVVTILLLKALKFIDTIYLRTQKDRIIPFIACMIWYFWLWYVWKNMSKTKDPVDIPNEAVQFALATFISTIIGLMVNIKMKVSLHAISMGIMITFILLLAFSQEINSGIYISTAFLIAGIVCTARFIISDHTQKEVYGGLAVGILSQLIASWAS